MRLPALPYSSPTSHHLFPDTSIICPPQAFAPVIVALLPLLKGYLTRATSNHQLSRPFLVSVAMTL
jgi:hypothetical protein